MRLIKIELNGFKSFADKTTIELSEPITGIVGPNGSGKSNIIDAIRWVLGQQKVAELRTKVNIDVIFSGSENKKKKNVAEVTIFLDNNDGYFPSDYSELMIKRRLYRTGENEYYINDIKCRLKDITFLLMDSGIGKDSFSIISQGKVEEIITSSLIKKREIIDEVAGIQKYRIQKVNTLKKLDKIKENINKVDFIVNEKEDMIEPLRLSSKKAILYKEIQEELSVDEKIYLSNKIFNYSIDLSNKEENFNDLKLKITEMTNIVETSQKKDNEMMIQKDSLQDKINKTNEELNALNRQKDIIEGQNELFLERKKLYSKDKSNKRSSFLSKNIENDKFELQELKTKLSTLIPKKNFLFEENNNLKNEYNLLLNENNRLNSHLRELKQETNKEFLPRAVSEILKLKNEKIVGTVGENFEIINKYELAINTILGNKKYELISKDTNTVQKCIEYLKKNKLSRVTFVPLDNLKERRIAPNVFDIVKNSNLTLGFAIDFVKYPIELKGVYENLFSNVIVCDTLDNANNFYKKYKFNNTIVTLDGDLILGSGKISGGYDKNRNTVKLKKDLEKIEEKFNSNNDKIKEFDKTKMLKQSLLNELNLEIELINNKINKLNINLSSNEKEFSSLSKTDTYDNSYLAENNIKLNEIKEEILSLLKVKEETKLEIEKLNLLIVKVKDEIIQTNAELKILIKDEVELEMEIKQIKDKMQNDILKLQEKYEISFQKAFDESIKVEDTTILEKKINKLKNKIKELGFVDLQSIQRYKDEKIKLDYYKTNLIDLNNSKDKIERIIEKLDHFVTVKFEETYEKLNIEFENSFKSLFNGGYAKLILTDKDDLLNTGVDIVVQPPGKKVQSITLLSGGEKALTAVALLLSILKIRTVPFAILDEVEAALDEVNVKRYIHYIKTFSSKTQFMIITHRQATMEELDKIFGVTMIEKGVSSIINAKFENKGVK